MLRSSSIRSSAGGLVTLTLLLGIGEGLSTLPRRQGRNILYTSPNCACVCAGTHEGYLSGVGNTGQCSESACVSAFRSCQYGEAKAFFSDGNKPQGTITGVMTQQSVNPAQCNTYVMGGSCSKEYAFSVTNGFITMISTSSDACVPGSAQQYQNYQTKFFQAAGHFLGNANNTAFQLTNKDGNIEMDVNQGCIVTYKVTSGGPLLGNTKGKCFPATATVQTPMGVKSMAELHVGDKVMSITAAGHTAYETVFMFSHQDQEQTAVFVNVVTEAGQTLKLTPGHFLWSLKPSNVSAERKTTEWSKVSHQGDAKPSRKRGLDGVADISASQEAFQSHRQIVRASDLKPGDYIWTVASPKDALVLSRVQRTELVDIKGLFNPHTASGNIVVDNVLALTFTESLPASPSLHAMVTAPAAALYWLMPTNRIAERINKYMLSMLCV